MKMVINSCYGGFGLSYRAVMRYAKLKGITLYPWIDDISRKVYGEKATIDNPEIIKHYSTSPVAENGEGWGDGAYFSERDIERTDPILVQVVEELGKDSFGRYAELRVVDIPDGVEWELDDYDGIETIHEKHQSWG